MFSVVGFSWFRPGQPAKEIPTKHGMETRPWLSELLIFSSSSNFLWADSLSSGLVNLQKRSQPNTVW